MADSSSWGEDTVGASAQKERLTPKQLGQKFPEAMVNPKALSAEDKAQQVKNIVHTYDSATPEERHAGFGWYAAAHREAVHMAAAVEPGPQHPAKPGKKSVYTHPPSRDAIARQSGNLAALSPAMEWGLNVKAAHEVHGLTPEHVEMMRAAVDSDKEVARTKRAADKAVGTPDEDDAAEVHYSTKRDAAFVKEAARRPLAGKAMNNQSTANILKAHDIHTGRVKPEDALPMDIKTGNFHTNIMDPHDSQGATIDTRSADIAMGQHFPWKTPRGLSAVGRYRHFVDVHDLAAQHVSERDGLHITPSKMQATTWVADKRAMSGPSNTGHGKHRQGETINQVHRAALAEPPNAPGPAAKKMTSTITAGRNRHGDDL